MAVESRPPGGEIPPKSPALAGPALSHSAPDFDVPRNACDCHVHVFGDPARYPLAPERHYNPETVTPAQLQRHLSLLKLDRTVIVQPSPYGVDNTCMLDAMRDLGERARGVAVVDPQTNAGQFEALHAAGVRGVRFNLQSSDYGSVNSAWAMIEHVARAIARYGWHIQLYAGLETIQSLRRRFQALRVPIVLDHFGGALFASGPDDERLQQVLDLVASRRVYVKISAPYLAPEPGPAVAVEALVDALLRAGPDRVLWASNWPHPKPPAGTRRSRDGIEPLHQTDDGVALNRVARQAMALGVANKLMVENPERLYWN